MWLRCAPGTVSGNFSEQTNVTEGGIVKLKTVVIIGGIALLLIIIVGATVMHNAQGVVAVQMAKVKPQDLTSTVTASGQITPKTFVNIGANAMGKITKLYVKKGDQIKQGEKLAQLENVPST